MSNGRIQRVRTDAGYHLRVVAANNEPLVTGEPLDDPRNVYKQLAALTEILTHGGQFNLDAVVEEVDER